MKRNARTLAWFTTTSALLALLAGAAHAQTEPASTSSATIGSTVNESGRAGVGPVIGNTLTGVGAKVWLSSGIALQTAFGTGPLGNNFRGQFDALFTGGRFNSNDGQYAVHFYVGVGGRAGLYFEQPAGGNSWEIGGRIPAGLSVLVVGSPIELFAEVAPNVSILGTKENDALGIESDSSIVVYADGAIGVRYYF